MFKQMVTENSRRKKDLAHEGPLDIVCIVLKNVPL